MGGSTHAGVNRDGRIARRGATLSIPNLAGMRAHTETIVIGAGQAGLATAYHLSRMGRDCVVSETNSRVGDGWRQQWDSLQLYKPGPS